MIRTNWILSVTENYILLCRVCQIRKTTKNHSLDVGKNNVETYSSTNAAALDREERAVLHCYLWKKLCDKYSLYLVRLLKKNQ